MIGNRNSAYNSERKKFSKEKDKNPAQQRFVEDIRSLGDRYNKFHSLA